MRFGTPVKKPTASGAVTLTAGLLVSLGLAWAGEPRADLLPGEPPAVVRPTPDDLKALAAGNNRLALELYAKLCAKEKGNLFFSPYSIRMALAMTYAGARGETAAQLRQALHFGRDDATRHAAFAAAIQAVNAGGQNNCELTVANSLWGEQTHEFLAPFVELIRHGYGAGLERVDFKTAAEPARLKINGWVEDRTRQKIKNLITPGGVDAATRLVLVNAVYFNGRWAVPFVKKLTAAAPFQLAGGRTVPAPLMTLAAAQKFPFFAGAGLKLLELEYHGQGVALVVMLPDATSDLAALEAKLNEANLTKWLAELESQEVVVHLPRFTLTWGTNDLGPNGLAVLPAVGMPLPFDDQHADFSGMDGQQPASAGGLFLGAVFHQAFVAVDEEGTEATAATAVRMIGGVPPPPAVFRVDRPFLFLIREKASGSILFLGRVTNPVAP